MIKMPFDVRLLEVARDAELRYMPAMSDYKCVADAIVAALLPVIAEDWDTAYHTARADHAETERPLRERIAQEYLAQPEFHEDDCCTKACRFRGVHPAINWPLFQEEIKQGLPVFDNTMNRYRIEVQCTGECSCDADDVAAFIRLGPCPPHRQPEGPNEDTAICPRCGQMTYEMRPPGETYGTHLYDCSLPIDHESYCVGGGSGHPPADVVRG
jgi:hypothetical protein